MLDLFQHPIYNEKMKCGYVYILANQLNGTLYVGVTSDLVKRIYEHKNHLAKGFTDKYNVTNLVYYEIFNDIATAIAREKQIKGWRRLYKTNVINDFNPDWGDLYDEIIGLDSVDNS